MYIVYVLQNSRSHDFYIGYTTDLPKRIQSHNQKRNRATNREGKWKLIYAEAYRSKKDARIREKKLKHHGSALHGLKKRLVWSVIEDKK